MDQLIASIATSGNLAVVVLSAVNLALFHVLRELHRSIREDREAESQRTERLTQAITELRIEMAKGRP